MTESSKPLTYADVGVDIDRTDKFVERIKGLAKQTKRPEVIADIGSFAGLFRLPQYRKPVLVASADGVGTKVKLAALLERYQSVGIDIVNHCVNDILTCGADPIFFLDYIGSSALKEQARIQIIDGVVTACRDAGCALLGGETADMPQVYEEGDFDLVGFIVGIVEEDEVIDGSTVAAGDILIGLPSNGLHTNGYSLVRKVFGVGIRENAAAERKILAKRYDALGSSLGDELMKPHKSYYRELAPLKSRLKGICHITGSGISGESISGNILRILPSGLQATIRKGTWDVQPIFRLIQQRGNVHEDEMFRTFNMGLGMVLIVDEADVQAVLSEIPSASVIGSINPREEGEPAVSLPGSALAASR